MQGLSFGRLRAYIGGRWVEPEAERWEPIYDPGRGVPIGQVPFCGERDVGEAVEAAQRAFEEWSSRPVHERVRLLLRIRAVLEERQEELAALTTLNHGKTLRESRGDMRRTMENVEAAIAATIQLAKGERLDEVGRGIDTYVRKEPLGVFAVIGPFNFPIMVPFWFIPYALGLGCAVVVKPSEVTPLPLTEAIRLLEGEAGVPPGLVNVIHGGKETAEALIRHRDVKGVCFVGSTPAARSVYRLAGELGKRCIAGGGAKNFCVVLPDADLASTVPALLEGFFGNAGQRCLSSANLVAVGEAEQRLVPKLTEAAARLRVGYGFEEATEMGPLVSARARERVSGYVEAALREGARLTHGGKALSVPGYEGGFYFAPTVLTEVLPDMKVAKEEVFGPVAGVMRAEGIEQALELVNGATGYGNAVTLFTRSGASAREFARRVKAGNVGINVPVPAPVGYFPFGGMRDSFFGILHPQMDSVEFFTDKKVVIERW